MRFSAGGISSITTASVPLFAIRCPATEMCKLRELCIVQETAVLMRLGLCRAGTVSVTPGGTFAGQNHYPGAPASGTLLVNSWGTAPVVTSAIYFRQTVIPQTSGAGVLWTWPADDPLIVGNGTAIAEVVIVNLAAVTAPLYRWYACWED